MTELQKQNHSNAMYTALVFARIRIHPAAPLLSFFSSDLLKLNIFRVDAEPSPRRFIDLDWEVYKSNLKAVNELDKIVLIEAMPGIYDLHVIGFGFSSTGMAKFIFSTSSEKGFTTKPKRRFNVIPNTMTYLGTIDITISNYSYNPYNTYYGYDYTMRFKNNLKEDLDLFKKKYPALFEKYKDNIRQGL
jgi:hypothetical protein